MDRSPRDRAPLRTLGFIAVYVPGMIMLYAIPVLFSNDDELGPAQLVLVLMTVVPLVGAAILSRRTQPLRRLAVGLVVGYLAWLPFFVVWLAAGP